MAEEIYRPIEEPEIDKGSYAIDARKIAGIGLIGVMIVGGLLLLMLPPIGLGARLFGGGGFTEINEENPVLRNEDGLAVSTALLDGTLALRIESVSRSAFYEQTAGGDWEEALVALPDSIELVSPIFELGSKGESSLEILFNLRLPEGSRYEALDLYAWDAEVGMWTFLPNRIDANSSTMVARVNYVPNAVAVFLTGPATPSLTVVQDAGQSLSSELMSVVDVLMPTGLQPTAAGTLSGSPVAGASGNFAVIPIVRNYETLDGIDNTSVSAILADVTVQQAHINALMDVVMNGNLAGIGLDYRGLSEAQGLSYTAFVTELANRLHAEDKQLHIVLPPPASGVAVGSWDTAGYDWRALGAVADSVEVWPGLAPTDYVLNGRGGQMLAWATDEISRYKLRLGTSTLPVLVSDNVAQTIGYEGSLVALAPVIDPPLPEDAEAYLPGDIFALTLGGEGVSNIGVDPTTGIYRYTSRRERRPGDFWIVTAAKVRERLALAPTFNLGGVVVQDLLSDDNAAGMEEAIIGYKVGAPIMAQQAFEVEWVVTNAEAEILGAFNVPFGEEFTWESSEDMEGEFTLVAALLNPERNERGSVELVLVAPTPEPTPEPVFVASGPAPPAAAASTASGNFELGGQTHTLANPGLMQSAGMTWVKYQQKWSPGQSGFEVQGRVDQAHASGFKVLFSLPGPVNPSSIDYGAYINYLTEVAQTGVDGIEVWNEMNLSREWPAGDISGGSYVNNMLAPSYNAIKAVNPGILVISGALAPTGAFGGCGSIGFVSGCDDWLYNQQMAEAGAANFMDCVGVHFNSGATSPTVSSGHPADGGDGHYTWYFQGMVNAYSVVGKPLCFTEMGYLSDDGYPSVAGTTFDWGKSTTVAQQAQWLAEAVSMARGFARLMIIWNVDIFTYDPSDPQGGYAIIRPDSTCPACSAIGSAP